MNLLNLFNAIVVGVCLIVLCNAQTEPVEHIMIYERGYYGVDNVLDVNLNKEYILAFPNTSTSNPYRISAYSEDSSFLYPALVVVRQEKQVLSWQVPMIVPSTLGLLYFRNTSRTLCYSSRAALGHFHQDSSAAFKRNFSVSVSTSSPENIQVVVRADEVKEFYIENDKVYTAKVSPSQPVFYHYAFPEREKSSRAYIEIDSEDDVCLMASVQDTFCPVHDLNQNIEFEGHFQTINMKGAMIISEKRYPNGFFLVFVARSDNYECTQESSLLPLPRSLIPSIKTLNRTTEIKFTIRDGPTEEDYLAATLVVFLGIVGFCIIFITIIVIFYCCRKKNMDEVDGDEDEVDMYGLSRHDIINRYLDRDELTVQDFCAKRMQRKSFNYFWHIMNIAIFYGIPVVQLMVAYQRLVNVTGDLDTCYHNFMCANPLGDINDFNHIYSNIGYMLLGVFFLGVTFVNHKKHVVVAKCGIPRHYGLFYAMGVALIVEGILSACYHICPNQSNYQFDTSFMYVMAVLIMVKLYQNRHPRINASAYATFTVLGIAVFMAMLGILTNSIAIMVIFVLSYLILCIFVSFKIYFFGYVISGVTHVVEVVHEDSIKSAITPIRKVRFVLLCIANLCNLTLAIVGIIFYPSYTDFGTYLLGILMINSIIHCVFYLTMKLYNKERICIEACLYGVLAIICWAFAAYFFLNGSTLWSVTAAESRQLNKNCVFMNFYDNHDLWHLISAPGMFFIFMFLMHLDDDLVDVPRSKIKAF